MKKIWKAEMLLVFMLLLGSGYSQSLQHPIMMISPPQINPPAGRIAIVADGNSPDPDDLGGTAVSIAMLRATGLEGRLVHYSHSCDLVRKGPRISEKAEIERHALMQSSCDVTARRWGGFESLTFYDAKWQKKETIKDLCYAIERLNCQRSALDRGSRRARYYRIGFRRNS